MKQVLDIVTIFFIIYIILAMEIHIESKNFSFHWDSLLYSIIDLYFNKK